MNRSIAKKAFLLLCTSAVILVADVSGQTIKSSETNDQLDKLNVVWDQPGPSAKESMPTGNGDIALNAWVEQNGDICFFIAKTDAWGAAADDEANGWLKDGGVLMKLGKVRLSLSPSPLKRSSVFRQVLKLSNSEIVINEGAEETAASIRIWVDANNPVIRVESKSNKPVLLNATLENWRIGKGDSFVADKSGITWLHQNPANGLPHLKGIIFGGKIKGTGLVKRDNATLSSAKAGTSQLVTIYPLTTKGLTGEQWKTQLDKQVAQIDLKSLEQTRLAHRNWWNKFWHRSWIYINGNDSVRAVNQGYVLQRYITACAGRGAYPIKFNGSLFVVDYPDNKVSGKTLATDADYREWGGQYWMQNTRPMYWPRLKAGDFDLMIPLFNMYAAVMKDNAAQIKKYYNHDGVYFAETMPFWGGLKYVGPEVKENWTDHYFLPVLELSMMMLDYYEFTGDKKFAKEILLPVASEGIKFYDQHFGRDTAGKLLLDPVNSIEQFWKVHNPAPDIAGLNAVTSRLIKLPADLVSQQQRSGWQRFMQQIPELPVGQANGVRRLLPYTGPQTAKPRNFENPELYAIYPFRLYGAGKADYQLALETFNSRTFREKGCWNQDPIQAAMLGLADVAKIYVSYNLTRKDPALKFPAFWSHGHDYMPDQDNGGNGEHGLQEMLMQTDGKKILLLPAWPKEWDTAFKLNAPYNTTVQGKVRAGKIVELTVIPAYRKNDVIYASGSK
jgi:alpha-L-fucosidase 2